MKDRIRMIMESQHMTQKLFADSLGISPATLSSIFTGRTMPTLAIVDAIKKRFPSISTDWILFGKGSMQADGQPAEAQENEAANKDGSQPQLDFASPKPSQPQPIFEPQPREVQQQHNNPNIVVKNIDKPQRKIAEIRVFYDDQTWETFVPKN